MSNRFILAAVLTAMSTASAFGQVARPAPDASQWYFGVGAQGMSLTGLGGTNLPSSLSNGMTFAAGHQFNRYYAAEFSFTKSDAAKSVVAPGGNYRTKLSVSGVSLDGYAFLPIARGPISLFATAGAGYYSGRAESSNTAAPFLTDKQVVGYRAGGGIRWKLDSSFSIDATARYQHADFGFAKSNLVYSINAKLFF